MTDDGRGMWLRTELNGLVTDTPAAPLGAVLRIAVGEPGRRSSVWRIWSNRTASDVYVAARTVAGVQKFSFHESGAWRYAWVGTPPGGTADDDRAIDRWRRSAAGPAGWTKMLSIWVRAEDVTPVGPR